MIINVGTREVGYKNVNDILNHYLDNVVPRYEDSILIENNKFLVSDYLKIGATIGYVALSILGFLSGDIAFASGLIDTAPIDRFVGEVYWTMAKIAFYLSSPVWAWVGIILLSAGANQEKRTLAKKIGSGLVIGSGIVASAPWASKQLYALWGAIFA